MEKSSFRTFLHYLAIAYNDLRKEYEGRENKITVKKLVETMIFMYFIYDEDVAKEKAKEIYNNLELVWWKKY